jgi:undecaprenyl-diphosphatase
MSFSPWILVKGANGVALSLFVLFCTVLLEVQLVGITVADYRLGPMFADLRDTHADLLPIMQIVSDALGTWVAVGLPILIVVELLRRRRFELALACLIAFVGTLGVSELVKYLVHRPRPMTAGLETSWSFPSGHTMRAMACYGFVAYLVCRWRPSRSVRVAAILAATALVLLVGFSRMFLGKHYPSDVTGALPLGGCILSIIIAKLEARARRSLAAKQIPLTSPPSAAPPSPDAAASGDPNRQNR